MRNLWCGVKLVKLHDEVLKLKFFLLDLSDANSTEFDPDTKHPVVGIIILPLNKYICSVYTTGRPDILGSLNR